MVQSPEAVSDSGGCCAALASGSFMKILAVVSTVIFGSGRDNHMGGYRSKFCVLFQLFGVLLGASAFSGTKSEGCHDLVNRSCVARPPATKLEAPKSAGNPNRLPSRITWYG